MFVPRIHVVVHDDVDCGNHNNDMNEDIKLECTRCNDVTDWVREKRNVVRCMECKKIHSDDSLVPVWGLVCRENL